MKKTSELEGVCLGIVYKFQPCTAYRVRRALKESPSSHWRASAGSVYPLLSRLEAGEFIYGKPDVNDGRGRKLLRITASGRKALGAWIAAGAEPDLVCAIMDPVRSRMFFLDVLTEKQRGYYLDELITQMEKHYAETRTRLRQSPETQDRYAYLGALGAMQVTKARLDWLRLVRKRVGADLQPVTNKLAWR